MQALAQVELVDGRAHLRLTFYPEGGHPVPSGAFTLLPEVAEWLLRQMMEEYDVDLVQIEQES